MKPLRLLILSAALSSTVAIARPVYTTWAVGQEREIDDGVYARLVKQQSGWRLWRFETKNGVTCKAIKSARGRPHPVPVGVSSVMFRGTPFLEIRIAHGQQFWSIEGSESGESVLYRHPGDRFWDSWDYNTDLANLDGQPIEVSVTSWEYPEIHVGLSKEKGIIDLTGLSAILSAGEKCSPKILPSQRRAMAYD